MSQLTYKIAKLWGKPEGSSEKFELNETIEFPQDPDLTFEGNFTGKLFFIRLKDEISVLLNNAQIEVNFSCTHCLKSFTQTIKIAEAEREFFYDPPDFGNADISDLFYINRKPMTIDLNEMVRQEIILHFPLIPVCSKGCKGLCQQCGKDLNKAKCKCKKAALAAEEPAETHRPFKNLKNLI